jgi:large subunit ribosomal protein L7A
MGLEGLKQANKVVGAKQVKKALEKDRVKMVYFAQDADRHVTDPLREICTQKGIPVETAETMKKLGEACRIDVGAATVAILKD